MKMETVFLDLTGIYAGYDMEEFGGARRCDAGGIAGTDMYCSEQAQEELMKLIAAAGVHGLHFIDSGNYHYLTKLFTDMIDFPFSLVLFDNHTDMQDPLFGGMLSCGGWAKDVLCGNRYLRQLMLIGPPSEAMGDISIPDEERKGRLLKISREDMEGLQAGDAALDEALRRLDRRIPLYISVDKDILSAEYAATNWDQGEMSAGTLAGLLRYFAEGYEIIGADICGECSPQDASLQSASGDLNLRMNRLLYGILRSAF